MLKQGLSVDVFFATDQAYIRPASSKAWNNLPSGSQVVPYRTIIVTLQKGTHASSRCSAPNGFMDSCDMMMLMMMIMMMIIPGVFVKVEWEDTYCFLADRDCIDDTYGTTADEVQDFKVHLMSTASLFTHSRARPRVDLCHMGRNGCEWKLFDKRKHFRVQIANVAIKDCVEVAHCTF